MSLTSFQKNYIKKNLKKLSVSEISLDLSVSEKEINKFLKKQNLNKFSKIYKTEDFHEDGNFNNIEENVKNFNFSRFIVENLWVFILLFFLVFVSYYNSLGNEFVSDDIVIKNGSAGKLDSIFNPNIFVNAPLTIYFFIYKMKGLSPDFYRIFNIFFHLGFAYLVFIILNLTLKKRIAIFAALIFAVHPILVEPTSWISGMPYAGAAFFSIG